VAEVERPGRAHLERIAARRDVTEVQLRAAVHHPLHHLRVPAHEVVGVLLDVVEEPRILQERDLHGLGEATTPFAIR
jgi:hypothetical protein